MKAGDRGTITEHLQDKMVSLFIYLFIIEFVKTCTATQTKN